MRESRGCPRAEISEVVQHFVEGVAPELLEYGIGQHDRHHRFADDGGGGHGAAGTCQVDNDLADATLRKLITRINADG